ncbi:MAG: hypothetical protein ABI253_04540 [Mycobacterium sp.]
MEPAGSIADALAEWVGRQRWFVGASTRPTLRIVAALPFPADSDVPVVIYFVADETEDPAVIYQVPVAWRRRRPDAAVDGFITTMTDDRGVGWSLYDGPWDPAFTHPLLRLMVDGQTVGDDRVQAWGVPGAPWPVTNVRSRVLRGEQSNTSIVYSHDGPDAQTPVICKIFRMVHHGQNPDVVLQSALFAAGSDSVPAIFGSVASRWPDPERPDGQAYGHLAFAQQFLSGAEDAWLLALDAVGSADFSDSARQLGTVTADVHDTLARVLPTRAATADDVAAAEGAWQVRLDAAIREVPELETLRRRIQRLYDSAAALPWPRLQLIHGDLHLGQILAVPNGGWVIIDFEGEPMRPLAERSVPDLPLRDVAGMLRSFDYVAGCRPGRAAAEWASACRAAFIEGYRRRSGPGTSVEGALLDAFELDKALYEVVYEARNRREWLPIPIGAVRRLAARIDARQ